MRFILWLIIFTGAIIFIPPLRQMLRLLIGEARLEFLRIAFWVAIALYFAFALWITPWERFFG